MLISCIARYNATVEALTPNGYYVAYDGWGNSEEVCSPFLEITVLFFFALK